MKKLATALGMVSMLALLGTAGSTATAEQSKGIFRNVLVVFAPPTQREERTVAERVDLTESQRTEMKAVSQRYRADSSKLKADYDRAYGNLVEVMQQTNPNKNTVNQRLKEFHRVHSQLVEHEVEYWADFKGVMTPQQNREFWAMFEETRVRNAGR